MWVDGREQTCETIPGRSDKMLRPTAGFVGIPQQMLGNNRQECWSVEGTWFSFHTILTLAPVIGRIMAPNDVHACYLHGKETLLKTMEDIELLSPRM